MAGLSDFSQLLPWLGAGSAVVGLALLIWSIRALIRLLNAAEIVRAALLSEQELSFPQEGNVVLCVEGPLLTRRFSDLSFSLQTEYGIPVSAKKHWFRAKSSGFSKVRLQLQSFWLPHPGRYRLLIEGLGEPQPEDSEHAIVFAKPHLAATVGFILSILLASWLLIGGIVLALLNFFAQ